MALAQDKPKPTQIRVYVEASFGHVYLASVDHAVPRVDADGHNQTMELAKTFLQRCPEVIPTLNEAKADFKVVLNFAERTRFFMLGKLLHKPDQIIVINKDGDVVYSGVARSLGGDTEAVCRIVMAKSPQHGNPLGNPLEAYWSATNTSTTPLETPAACTEYATNQFGLKDCTQWAKK